MPTNKLFIWIEICNNGFNVILKWENKVAQVQKRNIKLENEFFFVYFFAKCVAVSHKTKDWSALFVLFVVCSGHIFVVNVFVVVLSTDIASGIKNVNDEG